jgi:hypothetical protein
VTIDRWCVRRQHCAVDGGHVYMTPLTFPVALERGHGPHMKAWAKSSLEAPPPSEQSVHDLQVPRPTLLSCLCAQRTGTCRVRGGAHEHGLARASQKHWSSRPQPKTYERFGTQLLLMLQPLSSLDIKPQPGGLACGSSGVMHLQESPRSSPGFCFTQSF